MADEPNILERREQAKQLLASNRGAYIIGQALTLAIEALEMVDPPVRREVSNIEDMKLLRDTLFPMYHEIKEAERRRRWEQAHNQDP